MAVAVDLLLATHYTPIGSLSRRNYLAAIYRKREFYLKVSGMLEVPGKLHKRRKQSGPKERGVSSSERRHDRSTSSFYATAPSFYLLFLTAFLFDVVTCHCWRTVLYSMIFLTFKF